MSMGLKPALLKRKDEMNERNRVFLLIAIMATACILVVGIAIFMLYNAAYTQQKNRLIEIAKNRARTIEATARFDAVQSKDYPGGPRQATMDQILDAHKHFRGFGNTGEFTLAEKKGQLMVFLLNPRYDDSDKLVRIPFDSKLAEPMRRALSGLSGTVTGLDYRGVIVLAAYEPVAVLNVGIVAKIDMSEIRAPFIKAGLIAALFAVIVVMTGTILFFKITDPILLELKKRTADLLENKKWLQTTLRSIGDAVIATDARGHITLMNPISEKLTGWEEKEAQDRPIEDIFNIINEQTRERAENPVNRVLRDGLIAGLANHTVLIAKDGTELPIDDSAAPIKDDEGNISGVVMVFRDVSERMKAQKALNKAYSELEVKVENRTAGLIRVNRQLKQEIEVRRLAEEAMRNSEACLNEAQKIAHIGSYERNLRTGEGWWSDEYYCLLGYEPGEIPCSFETVKAHVHPDDREYVLGMIQEAISKGITQPETEADSAGTHPTDPYEFRFRYIRKNGEVRVGYTFGVVRQDKSDGSIIFSGTLQDITERVKMETNLQEKQAQIIHAGRLSSLGEMVTGIAHELNQPLSIIRLDAESLKFLLKKAGHLQPDYEAEINSVIANVDRAANIIEYMRGFARVKDDGHEPVNLTEPLNRSLVFFKEQFRHHEILLQTDYEQNLPLVMVSPQRFGQIAVNFLSNARYAVDKRGEQESAGDYRKEILLRLFYDENRNALVFEARDNGIGMTPEEKSRCQEPFFTTKEVGEGTGLGLSIVRGIIKEFDGSLEIEIESEKGVGTTMRVILKV
jgi:PAS domain S-box-containing protein